MDVNGEMTGRGAGSPVPLLEGRVSFRLQSFIGPFCLSSLSLPLRLFGRVEQKCANGNMLPSWTRAYLVVCRVDDTSKC